MPTCKITFAAKANRQSNEIKRWHGMRDMNGESLGVAACTVPLAWSRPLAHVPAGDPGATTQRHSAPRDERPHVPCLASMLDAGLHRGGGDHAAHESRPDGPQRLERFCHGASFGDVDID